MDKLKGYKTVIVNGLLMLAGVLVVIGVIDVPSPEALESAAETTIGLILALQGAANLILRKLTTTPLGESE